MSRLVEVFKKEKRRQDSLSRDMAQVVKGSCLITDIQNWAGTKNSTLRFSQDRRGWPAHLLLHPKLGHSEAREAMVLQPAEALEMFGKLRDSIQEMIVAARADDRAGVIYTSEDLDPYWFEDSRIRN
jgi:hypothetical protein